MPRGSAPGERRGGRQRGMPNRRTLELQALAEGQPREGTPLEFLTSVYRNEALSIDLRIEAASRAAPYVHPRLTAVTVGGNSERPLRVVNVVEIVPVAPEPRE